MRFNLLMMIAWVVLFVANAVAVWATGASSFWAFLILSVVMFFVNLHEWKRDKKLQAMD